jgi:site-specific recombinase XerD
MTFKEAAKQYENIVKIYRSEGTHRYYLGKINVLIDYFGSFHLEEITLDTVTSFILDRKRVNEYISNITLNKYIVTMNQVLKHFEHKKINVPKLPEQRPLIDTISLGSIKKVFNHYESNLTNIVSLRNYLMFRLFYETGMRLTELLHLKIQNIDFKDLSMRLVQTKTNTHRYVFFTQETRELLEKYVMKTGVESNLFIDINTGENLKTQTIESITSRLQKKLKLKEKINPHAWRHTFATRMINNNANIEYIRLYLGHSNISTTQRYFQVSKQKLRDEYFRINNQLNLRGA